MLDETSLLSLQLIADIDHALQFAKEKPDLWFGGVNIIFAGDFFQFPPVRGSPLYSPIAPYAGQTNDEIQKCLGRLAWKTIDTVISLTEQQHMKEDKEYAAAVTCLRTRECIHDDVDLFNSHVIGCGTNPQGVSLAGDLFDATAIVSMNNVHESLNNEKVCVGSSQSGNKKSLIVCHALNICSCQPLDLSDQHRLLHLNVSSNGSSEVLPGSIPFYIDMPIILQCRNLSTDLGITNGSQGYVKKIFTNVCAAGLTYATCIIAKFPDSKVRLKDLLPQYFPITPISCSFTTNIDSADKGTQKI